MEKKVIITTQFYDVPSGEIRNQFVGILLVELDIIWNRQWNAGMVIIFHLTVLQRVSGVSQSINIRDRIYSRLDLWKKGAYKELVQYYNGVDGEVLGNNRLTQTQEQRHCTLSNLVFKGELSKAVHFIRKW